MRRNPVALALAAVLLAGCSVLGSRSAPSVELGAGVDLQPPAGGAVVEISHGEAGGTNWLVVAYVAQGGDLCLADIVSGSFSGSTCGPMDVDEDGFGLLMTAPFIGDDGLLIAAVLSPDARTLGVEAGSNGVEVSAVSLEPIGVDAVAASLHLARGMSPTAVYALDGASGELGRRDLGPGL